MRLLFGHEVCMRTAFSTLSAVLIAGGLCLAQAQEPRDKEKLPEKGDSVLVKGCLNGLILQATETTVVDATGRLAEPLSYQLKGDKALLKKMRESHDGHLVDVAGTLKSSLQGIHARGKQVGKTRVFIGMGPTADQRRQAEQGTEQPVLEVKSFEGYPTVCAR
jgi:hypothetical protein